jgi:(1->4)-alpha-D-glucan 1-alpha-D-glucosylmutase
MTSDVPLSIYRLQLTKHFGFDDAAALVPYLKELGITHLYTSPFLKARPGSTHGYDIVDHDRLNPELGGDKGFARLGTALKEHGLGLILDFVPNHTGVGSADNVWWLDVLEWGPGSPHARSFDIDWNALPHRRHPGVLLPILGRLCARQYCCCRNPCPLGLVKTKTGNEHSGQEASSGTRHGSGNAD